MTKGAQEPLILGFDTSGGYCAAALVEGQAVLAERFEDMKKGQAERLMPFLQDLLNGCGHQWRNLSALGVGVGPGNFTGIRIAVSAARGLALGLNVPAVGVSGFEALARIVPIGHRPAIPAPRDQVYVLADGEPALMTRPAAAASGALYESNSPEKLARSIALVAAERWATTDTPPTPLYVRPANAAPSSDAPPVLIPE